MNRPDAPEPPPPRLAFGWVSHAASAVAYSRLATFANIWLVCHYAAPIVDKFADALLIWVQK